jgi:PEP-CTERM motif
MTRKIRSQQTRSLLFVLLVFGLTLAMGSSAFADEMFYLTVPENSCVATPPCAPADTVLVDVDLLTPSTATVTFTGQTLGTTTYGMYAVFFEVNGSFGISSEVVTVGGVPTTTLSPAVAPGSLDLYGTFDEDSGVVHDASSVVFNLDDGSWTSAANVLTTTKLPNGNAGDYAQPFDAAAQVRVSDCTSSSEPGCTGDTGIDGSTMDSAGYETAVPEPASLLLFGSLVLGLATFARRKFSAGS